MTRKVDWPVYDRLTEQFFGVVADFVRDHPIDAETMMAVLILFQASILTGPAMRVQAMGADKLEAFLSLYTADVARMVREMVARAQDLGLHVE